MLAYEKVGPEFAVNTEVRGHQTNPQIATFADGSFLITWVSRAAWPASGQTIKAQLFDASGAKAGSRVPGQRPVRRRGVQSDRDRARRRHRGGHLDQQRPDAGGPGGVKARMFDSAGNALGGEFKVNTSDRGSNSPRRSPR